MNMNDYKTFTNEALDNAFMRYEDLRQAAGMSTEEGQQYRDEQRKVYEEMKRRGEGKRWAFLNLKRKLAEHETQDIIELAKKINILCSALKDDFSTEGDPISPQGFLMCSLSYFLEAELIDRGYTNEEVIEDIFGETDPEILIAE